MNLTIEAVGGFLGFVSAGIAGLIIVLFKRVITDLEKMIDEVDGKVDTLAGGCVARHNELPDRYVPRNEIAIQVQALKESSEEQRRQMDALHKKVDSLILLVRNGA